MVRPLPRQSEAHATAFYRTLALMTRDAIERCATSWRVRAQDDEAGDEEA